jgi:predicted GNAT superfamily acetyltransferase
VSFRARMTAATGVAADTAFAESVLIRPMVVNQHVGATADPARPERTVAGRFGRTPEVDDLSGAAPNRDGGLSTVAGADAAVTLRAAVAAGLGYSLRRGDKVVLLERAGAPSYTVVRAVQVHVEDVMVFVVADSPNA